jgi:phosphoenolpyruvate synthase/pyruvate phosphate dikinase
MNYELLNPVQGLPIRSTMGVIIQKLIPSRVSGVCFSANPMNGDRSEVLTIFCLLTYLKEL